jgi:hypothetical protein
MYLLLCSWLIKGRLDMDMDMDLKGGTCSWPVQLLCSLFFAYDDHVSFSPSGTSFAFLASFFYAATSIGKSTRACIIAFTYGIHTAIFFSHKSICVHQPSVRLGVVLVPELQTRPLLILWVSQNKQHYTCCHASPLMLPWSRFWSDVDYWTPFLLVKTILLNCNPLFLSGR